MKKVLLGFLIVLLFNSWSFAQENIGFAGQNQFSNGKNTAKDEVNSEVYVNDVSLKLAQEIDSVDNIKDLVSKYCEVVLGDQGNFGNKFFFGESNFMYSARQSLFVFTLCSNVVADYSQNFPYAFNSDFQYVSGYSFSGFGGSYNKCSILYNNNLLKDCDFSRLGPDIFDGIVAEYFSIRQASVYGIYSKDLELNTLEKQANDFVEGEILGELLCDSDGKKDGECRYPKVIRKVDSYQRKAIRLLDFVKFMKIESIYKNYLEVLESNPNYCDFTQKSSNYNIVLCGLYGDRISPMNAFVNLLYNELFYYRLFMDYYISMLDLKSVDLLLEDPNRKSQEIVANRQLRARKNLMYSTQAMDMSMQSLSELYLTYPIHIGFLMLITEYTDLRDSLTRLAPGLYTLTDKMKNPQEPLK